MLKRRQSDFVDEYYTNNDLSILKKLTLVIPTYNRNYYLSRCLWYHAHFPFGQIIVADSSPDEKKIVNRETVAKVREAFGTNILYLEYKPETEKYGGDIYRKWGDAVQHVTTEYSQIVTDKEFSVPLGVIDAIQYLDTHPDYAAADARNYFLVKSEKRNENAYIFRQRRHDRHSETDEKPFNRFIDSFVTTQPAVNNCLIPSVMRSEIRKDVSTQISPDKVNDIRLGELVLAFFGHFHGKYHQNSELISLVRDVSVISSQNIKQRWNSPESSTTRYPTMEDLIKTENTKFFDAFRTSLSSHLTEYANMSKDEAIQFVNKNYQDKYFIRYYLEKPSLIGFIANNFPFVKSLWDISPAWMRKLGSKISLSIFNHQLSSKPIHDNERYDNAELNIIKKVVENTIDLHDTDKPIEIC